MISTSDDGTEESVIGRSRIRLIDDTSRARATLSTLSFRPKLWMTLATGTPVFGWRALWASWRQVPSSRPCSGDWTLASIHLHCHPLTQVSQLVVCLRFSAILRAQNALTRDDVTTHRRKCLRTPEPRSAGRRCRRPPS